MYILIQSRANTENLTFLQDLSEKKKLEETLPIYRRKLFHVSVLCTCAISPLCNIIS